METCKACHGLLYEGVPHKCKCRCSEIGCCTQCGHENTPLAEGFWKEEEFDNCHCPEYNGIYE